MRTRSITLLALVLIIGTASGAGEKAKPDKAKEKPANLREWTSTSGSKIEAEFAGLKGDNVVLKTGDGKLVEIWIQQLSPQDQLLARQLAAGKAQLPGIGRPGSGGASMGGPVAVDRALNRLPVFADGPAKGSHALYQRPKFEARVDDRGHLYVRPKGDDGKFVGKTIRFASFGWHYYDKADRRTKGRGVEEFLNPPRPSINPGELKLKGTAKDGVKFEVEYDFDDDRIKVVGEFKDPSGITYPSYMTIGSYIHPTHSIPPTIDMREVAKWVEGWYLRVKDTSKKTHEHLYHFSVTLSHHVKEAEILGPWGPRKVTFGGERLKKGSSNFRISNYSLYKPMQGYSFHTTSGSGQKTVRVTITVE